MAGAQIGLSWDGRWGRWADAGVAVVAAQVIELEVISRDDSHSADLAIKAAQEVGLALAEELPQGSACLCVHWVAADLAAHGRQQRYSLRAALLCDDAVAAHVQRVWQMRPLCGGRVVATALRIIDTASVEHGSRVDRFVQHLRRDGRSDTGFLMELPMHWLHATGEPRSVEVHKGNHWFDFATLFGSVARADFLVVGDPSVFHFLVRYTNAESAYAILATLMERYLYNPLNREVDDTHRVLCAVGAYDELRRNASQSGGVERAAAAATRRASPPPVGPAPALRPPVSVPTAAKTGSPAALGAAAPRPGGFALRLTGEVGESVAPSEIALSHSRPKVILGRETGTSDVQLRRPHVSKQHATLRLQPTADGRDWVVTIQDTSQNGTFVNGERLVKGEVKPLPVGARISFLPEDHHFYRTSLVYEVGPLAAAGPPSAAIAAAAAAAGTRREASGAGSGASPSKRPRPGALRAQGRGDPDAVEWVGGPPVPRLAPPVAPVVDVLDADPVADPSVASRNEVAPVRSRAVGSATLAAGRAEGARSLVAPGTATPPPVAEGSPPPDGATLSGEIGTWLRGLDGGSLRGYEAQLRALFENVTQIRELYSNRLQDFFEDVAVEDPNHRLAFATAIRNLK